LSAARAPAALVETLYNIGGAAQTRYIFTLNNLHTGPEGPMPRRVNTITHGARVLVVDDDADGAEAAGKLFETFGCSVFLVDSAGEALERIEEGADIDLVFSDVVMPDIDGLEFAERLNQVRPGLPVIFCTGYSSAVEALTDCGAMALMKPYSAEVLERIVAERLQLARDAARHPQV
jgi:CheY-like chemotaxis protein